MAGGAGAAGAGGTVSITNLGAGGITVNDMTSSGNIQAAATSGKGASYTFIDATGPVAFNGLAAEVLNANAAGAAASTADRSVPAMTTPNFDRIARAYRWLEYLTLGPLLERTRNHHIPRLGGCGHALVLGDGDGRFTARLLAANPNVQVDAVDVSGGMLALLARKCKFCVSRIRTHQADARIFMPAEAPDLIVTHFFLDCLTEPEVDALVARFAAPGTLWLVSDFRVPPGLLHWPARIYIGMLYLAFRVLTGLSVTRIPDYAFALRCNGFVPVAVYHRMCGVLTTELWSAGQNPVRSGALE